MNNYFLTISDNHNYEVLKSVNLLIIYSVWEVELARAVRMDNDSWAMGPPSVGENLDLGCRHHALRHRHWKRRSRHLPHRLHRLLTVLHINIPGEKLFFSGTHAATALSML